MRSNITIYGLFACSIGISAASTTERLTPPRDTGIGGPPSPMVILNQTWTWDPHWQKLVLNMSESAISRKERGVWFSFETNGAEISTVKLRSYNHDGDKNGNNDTAITQIKYDPSKVTSKYRESKHKLNLVKRGISLRSDDHDLLARKLVIYSRTVKLGKQLNELAESKLFPNAVRITFSDKDDISPLPITKHLDEPLYLEVEWTKSPNSGISTTKLFAIYDGLDPGPAYGNLKSAKGDAHLDDPARPERLIPGPNISPVPPTNTGPSPSASASPTSEIASPPVATTSGVQQESSTPAGNGLSRNGIIGVAVGVSVGGLLVAGIVAWLLWFRLRRRGRTATHHAMPSYASDLGAHTMLQDKEMPVILETASPRRSGYGGVGGGGGGGGDAGRPSTDHYAPYTDRSTTPDPRGGPAAAGAGAGVGIAVSTANQTQMGPTWTARDAPTPTPVIVSRYAHLVEEGMTDDELRRLEEEERQLDAAIENAGRRGNS